MSFFLFNALNLKNLKTLFKILFFSENFSNKFKNRIKGIQGNVFPVIPIKNAFHKGKLNFKRASEIAPP